MRVRLAPQVPRARLRTAFQAILVPLLGMGVSLWVLVTEVMRMPERAGIGLLILLAGLPIYAIWGQRQPMKKPS